MVFAVVVSAIGFARAPVEIELTLSNAVLEPMIAHVKGLGAFKTNGGMKYTMHSGVVCFKRGTGVGLRVAHFDKGRQCGEGQPPEHSGRGH
jgi:hypothetical protein